MAGATSIFPVKLKFLPFQALSLSWFDVFLKDYKTAFSLKPKKLLQFLSKILFVNICINKYCKIIRAGQFLYIKYLWNRTSFFYYSRYPNTKLFTIVGKKATRHFRLAGVLKQRSTFIFLKTQYPLSSFQQIMLKRLHLVKKPTKPKRTTTMYFLSDSHQEEGLFGGKGSRRVWQIDKSSCLNSSFNISH